MSDLGDYIQVCPIVVDKLLTEPTFGFQELFELSPDPTWIIASDHFVACNDAAVRVLGYADRASLMNVHPSELSPDFQSDGETSFAKANRMMALARENGQHRFEWMHTKADGSCFPAEVTLAHINVSGQPIIYCVWRDITERKQTEESLRRSEILWRTLYDSTIDAVMLLTTDGFIGCNKATLAIFGSRYGAGACHNCRPGANVRW